MRSDRIPKISKKKKKISEMTKPGGKQKQINSMDVA